MTSPSVRVIAEAASFEYRESRPISSPSRSSSPLQRAARIISYCHFRLLFRRLERRHKPINDVDKAPVDFTTGLLTDGVGDLCLHRLAQCRDAAIEDKLSPGTNLTLVASATLGYGRPSVGLKPQHDWIAFHE